MKFRWIHKDNNMNLPSKALMSEVLGFKVHKLSLCDNLMQWFTPNAHDCVNVYELAFRCKEWALKQNHSLTSWAYKTDSAFCEIGSREDDDYMFFEASTEVEAIFKACEYIMKQTNAQERSAQFPAGN